MEPKVKVELIKQICKWTGRIYYYVTIDGQYQSDTITSDPEKAREFFAKAAELVGQFPKETLETIETVEI